LNFISIDKLNSSADSVVLEAENLYADRVSAVAEKIFAQRRERPVVLISGPSGSGKTTTAHRIAQILKDNGCRAHTVSMDNYFLPLNDEERALARQGKFDFESPNRIDTRLFKAHLECLSRGEEIIIPTFDFAEQKRVMRGGKPVGMPLKAADGDIVIMEGIHALNPEVTGESDEYTNRLYVSVRTRLEHNGELLHPSKIRLMRRLIRDKLYRGRGTAETLDFFKSVERGENLYIMPYKPRASLEMDTFIEYEPMVYRDILLGDLEKISASYKDYAEFADMEKFLRPLRPVERELVPTNSLLREFIG